MLNSLADPVARVASLAYVGIEASDPTKWASFATEILGAATERGASEGTYFVRFDDHTYRVCVHPGTDGKLAYIGWEVRDAQTLSALAARLEERGFKCKDSSVDERRVRRVRDFVCLQDPAGNRIELCYGPDVLTQPFRPSRPDVSGFVALGHVVIGVPEPETVERFYVDGLGFKVTDYMDLTRPGRHIELTFLRCADGRNHSIALMNGNGLDHLMIEVKDMDDVGRILTACRNAEIPIHGHLGRHSNDEMVSFYLLSPGGLRIEYGWGGNFIDDETWTIRHLTSASLWGHSLG